jgi:NitT/TauT family transport system substrate-binding protein
METGSLAQYCVDYTLLQAGGNPKNIHYVALGNPQSAMNQLRSGAIDVLCASDPLITLLDKKGDLELLRNFRSLKETQRVFGGLLPGNSVMVPASLASKQPQVCQALVNGVVRANKWLRTAGPSDLLNTMLDSTYLTDRAIYLNAVDNMRESYSPDGALSAESLSVALKFCKATFPQWTQSGRKLNNSYTNEFVLQAKKRFKV